MNDDTHPTSGTPAGDGGGAGERAGRIGAGWPDGDHHGVPYGTLQPGIPA